jgi:hypothetical protein
MTPPRPLANLLYRRWSSNIEFTSSHHSQAIFQTKYQRGGKMAENGGLLRGGLIFPFSILPGFATRQVKIWIDTNAQHVHSVGDAENASVELRIEGSGLGQ